MMTTPYDRTNRRNNRFAALATALATGALLSTTSLHAADGTWNVDAGGNWNLDTNWSGNIIADGADSTANFSFNITGTRAVTATTGVGWSGTIGHLTFEDLTLASNNWSVGTGTLNLSAPGSSNVSIVNVVNQTATMGSTLLLAGNAINKTGAGTLILGNANNSFNGLTVTSGILLFDGGDVGASGNSRLGSGTVTLNGGRLQLSSASGRSLSRAMTLSADGSGLSAGTGAELTVTGVISGSHSLVLNAGSGRAMLVNQAANLFGGVGKNVRITGSTVNVIGDGSLGNANNSLDMAGNLHFGNTTVDAVTFATSRAIGLSASSALSVENGSTLELNGAITGANTLTFNNGGGYTATSISNYGAAGANSVVVLNGDVSGFSGPLSVSNGTVRFGSGMTLPASFGVLTMSNVTGGNLDLNGRSVTFKGLATGGANGGNIVGNATSGTNTLTVDTTGTNRLYSGVISDGSAGGKLALRKIGSNELELNRASTFTGGVTVEAGILQFTIDNAIASANTVTINGGSLDMSGVDLNIAGLEAAAAGGNVNNSLGAKTLTLSGSGNYSYAGSINPGTANRISILKTGAGTQTLSGNSTYTGTTSVNQGKLIVNGSLANTAVTVAGGATFGGSGTLAGAISGAGLVSAGNSPGVLTVGQVDPSGGLDFDFEMTQLGDPTWGTAAASGNDVVRITNVDAFSAALTADNVLEYVFSGHVSGTQTYRGGFFSTQDFTADLAAATFEFWVDLGGTLYAPISISQSVVAATANFGAGDVSGFTQEFTVTIPEPGTLALLGLALAALALSRRRR